MDDYVLAMGGVGLQRIINHGMEKGILSREHQWVTFQSDELYVVPEILPNIPELFFTYMLNHYSIANRERNRLIPPQASDVKRSRKGTYTLLKLSLDTQMKKLEKYFADDPLLQELQQLQLNVKSTLTDETDVDDFVSKYLNLLSTPAFDEKLTINYIKSSLMAPLHGQVSLLNVAKNSLDLQGLKDTFHKDFIEPVLRDWKAQQLYASQASLVEWREFVDTSENSVHKTWKKELKKWESDELDDYWNEQLRCTFVDDWFATDSYEEMVFSPLAVSKAINFFWDLNDKRPVPLSSWARLVIFLSSAGLTTYRKKVGDKSLLYHAFAFREGSAEDIIRINDRLLHREQGTSFGEVIAATLERERQKATFAPNIWFVEFSSDYRAKKTLMDYFTVPKHMAAYFEDGHAKQLNKIKNDEFRETFLSQVMQSIDPKVHIFSHLREGIKALIKGQSEHQFIIHTCYIAVRERQRIASYKKKVIMRQKGDVLSMQNLKLETELVEALYIQGRKIQSAMVKSHHSKKQNTEAYVSGVDKKLSATAYRLLNAANAGDKKQFLDTVMRLHLQSGVTLNRVFLNALHEDEVDFTTVSMSFMAGLLSYRSVEALNESNDGTDDNSEVIDVDQEIDELE